jgi:hypothetical protein
LRDYQGGYGERNLTEVYHQPRLVGLISGLGTTTRNTPNQFIPVGQSFFVNGKPLLPLLQLNIRTVKEGLLKKMKVVQI